MILLLENSFLVLEDIRLIASRILAESRFKTTRQHRQFISYRTPPISTAHKVFRSEKITATYQFHNMY